MNNPFTTALSIVTEPESLLVGAFSQWRRLLDYSDTEYALSYRMTPLADGSPRTISGTFDSSNEWWVFEVGSADLDDWPIGEYRWDLMMTRLSDSEVTVISTGSIVVHGSSEDRRTHAEVMVRKIESLLQNRADNDIESYSIKSRSLTKMSVKELREWREYYLAEIDRTGGSVTGADTPKKNTVRVRWV